MKLLSLTRLYLLLQSLVSSFQIHPITNLKKKCSYINSKKSLPHVLNLSPFDTNLTPFLTANNIGTLTSRIGSLDVGESVKSVVIFAWLFGGLVPTLIFANKAMFEKIKGKTSGDKPYITATSDGPDLPFGGLLLAPDRIPLVDIIAIIGRISDLNSMADWNNLPSTKVPDPTYPDNPPKWLPRDMFKENIRKASFKSWPIDPNTNLPVGGTELQEQYENTLKRQEQAIGDAALDAVFDTWAWGASIATPDKVQTQLNSWRYSSDYFDLKQFISASIRGRSVTGIGVLTFVLIQAVPIYAVAVRPALKYFLDIDL